MSGEKNQGEITECRHPVFAIISKCALPVSCTKNTIFCSCSDFHKQRLHRILITTHVHFSVRNIFHRRIPISNKNKRSSHCAFPVLKSTSGSVFLETLSYKMFFLTYWTNLLTRCSTFRRLFTHFATSLGTNRGDL